MHISNRYPTPYLLQSKHFIFLTSNHQLPTSPIAKQINRSLPFLFFYLLYSSQMIAQTSRCPLRKLQAFKPWKMAQVILAFPLPFALAQEKDQNCKLYLRDDICFISPWLTFAIACAAVQRQTSPSLSPFTSEWQRIQSQKKTLSLAVNINVEKHKYGKIFSSFHASLKLRSEIFAHSKTQFKKLTKTMITTIKIVLKCESGLTKQVYLKLVKELQDSIKNGRLIKVLQCFGQQFIDKEFNNITTEQ